MNLKSLIAIHVAVLLFGCSGLFGKLITYPAFLIVFGRVFFASILLGFTLIIRGKSFKHGKKTDYYKLGALGALLALHWTSFFYSIQLSSVAVGLITFSTFPIFVTCLEPVFFKTKLSGLDLTRAMVAVAGMILVIPTFNFHNNIVQGVIWGTVSGITFALLSILNKKLTSTHSSLTISFYQDLFAMVALAPFVARSTITLDFKNLFLLAVLGFFFTGLAHTLFIYSLQQLRTQTAALIACLEPAYGILFAWILIQEQPSFRIITGGLLILGIAMHTTLNQKQATA